MRGSLAARLEGGVQGCPGFGHALAAAGAQAQLARQIAQAAGPALHGGFDVPVRYCFADAYDHGAIVNANANDCQYRSERNGIRPAETGKQGGVCGIW